MNIQFSKDTAQKACDRLAEQTERITVNRVRLKDCVTDMHEVWTGPLANTVLGHLGSYDETFRQIAKFVENMDEYIAACSKNYQLTQKTNEQRLIAIANMFK